MKGINKFFVPLELAIQLKDKGFNEICFAYYQTKDLPFVDQGLKFGSAKYIGDHNKYDEFVVSAPLYQQVIDWFREKHQMKIFESEYFHVSGNILWYVKQYQKKMKCDSIDEAMTLAIQLIGNQRKGL